MWIFFLILGVLIIIHESGHFWAARKNGVKVKRFALGFGPELLKWQRKETEYSLRLFLLGGYVQLEGERPEEAKGEPSEFLSKTVGVRSKIVFAGPLLNYILGFLIFSFIFMVGSPSLTNKIGELLPKYPAESSGLRKGDQITQIDNKKTPYWEDVAEVIHQNKGQPIVLGIKRQDKELNLTIVPKVEERQDILGKKIKIGLVGIVPSGEIIYVKYNPLMAIFLAAKKTIDLTAITYRIVFNMLLRRVSFKEVTGPIGIYFITQKTAQMGFIYLLHFVGLLSVSLAIFNLLPFPVFDGGHLFFLMIEKIRRKPLGYRMQTVVQQVGYTLILTLLVFVIYNDMVRFQVLDKVATWWNKFVLKL